MAKDRSAAITTPPDSESIGADVRRRRQERIVGTDAMEWADEVAEAAFHKYEHMLDGGKARKRD